MERPDVSAALDVLKDFQRKTADFVFQRMYCDDPPARRFLLADEVGLGKTLVARGVVARTIEHLWNNVPRIDIVYICSNSDIARQNINRLNVTGTKEFAQPSRVTLLPMILKKLNDDQRKLNFISFTPGTSFDLKSRLGIISERVLLYWLLREAWSFKGEAPQNLFEGYATRASFKHEVENFNRSQVDPELFKLFQTAVEERPDLRNRFDELCERFGGAREDPSVEDSSSRTALVGELRNLLAKTCLDALQPDLIILDEFQRFKYLLDGKSESGQLAQDFFRWENARVLLLSATPYKMYTLDDESDTDDHYSDFLNTYRFLNGGDAGVSEFEKLLRTYRREIFKLAGGAPTQLRELKREIEERLHRVMVRTERLSIAKNRNGMLRPVVSTATRLDAHDVDDYLGMQRVSRFVEEGDTLEYWKSAPYLLNFMDDYQIKESFREAAADPRRSKGLAAEMERTQGLLLEWSDIERYREIDPSNARLRALYEDTVDKGVWKLLWMPPSLPYYEPAGVFQGVSAINTTKRLVFSAWKVVPKVIASLLSYEAERRMMLSEGTAAENTTEARARRHGLLRFSRDGERLTGMALLGFLYPSDALARTCDPLTLGRESRFGGDTVELPVLRRLAEERVGELLERLKTEPMGMRLVEIAESGPADEGWYWAAPILLDRLLDPETTGGWLRRGECALSWAGKTRTAEEEDTGMDVESETSAWAQHVEKARTACRGGKDRLKLGPMPADLVKVLALNGLAGPAVSALRALGRACDVDPRSRSYALKSALKTGAGSVAWALRGLFNLPEVMALLHGLNRAEPYWERVLEYCADGGLQATLDEYVQTLRESLGLIGRAPEESIEAIAEEMCKAITLRTATLRVDEIRQENSAIWIGEKKRTMHARFAVRFGQKDTDDSKEGDRTEQVRKAFNSPFWPFVLATTSVGQEGLDFHQYCHAVVHWNLPSNPVDLEQREGRVHRYKGHAVRKNVARYTGLRGLPPSEIEPWAELFKIAKAASGRDSDISPYWVFTTEGGALIERHVPAIPLSRDLERLGELLRALAIYRMVFGQVRQEELVAYLRTHMSEERVAAVISELRIDLSPPLSSTCQDGPRLSPVTSPSHGN
jgi:hypothetical protein